MSRPSVLFVCLGNICRSPLAEGAMRVLAETAGIDMRIESAATGDWHVGCEPDRRAQQVAQRHGVNISRIRARQMEPRDFHEFDHIVAMDDSNLEAARNAAPQGSKARLSLLLDHVPGRAGQSVADPYFGQDADFDQTWADIGAGVRGLAAMLVPLR
ncbi:MAG: low molecular weight protein-tyrosine-phosphatase [Paracoccus sp. (in: a-proteobacteria)]|uniref:low molecular weight protein-tyrosine-phosphatase n=1 Tax=Paracoccus sp. TaxID=267 RepID=UPI0039E64B74